ncbi:DUF1048 domain-containing protein [Kineococcus sp. SYSU DK002]|uniref:DUF1048 domain-containing protein n=1 Tax=Kineococcus sp. SYSU DK002 TaxID=3383123 RepID=UPI003D7EBB21
MSGSLLEITEKVLEKVTGGLAGKQRWREHRARVRALPAGHRAAVEALERYLTHRGVITDGGVLLDLHDELATAFERAAAQGTPVREVVGDDPAGFADALLAQHATGGWVGRERQRLVAAIAAAEARTAGSRS